MKTALILVDLQNDFVAGGELAVPDGNAVVPIANELMSQFDLVVATQDWHPPGHGSFAANHAGKSVYDQITLDGLPQTLWPVHCVQGSRGADLVDALRRDGIHRVVQKGTDPKVDSYSGFFDNARRHETPLAAYLREQGVTDVDVMGLATDYCVKFTALDALQLGFETYLIVDACRGVNVRPGDVDAAIEEMKNAGVKIVTSDQVRRP